MKTNTKLEIKSDPYLPAEASVTTTTAYFIISSFDGKKNSCASSA
jgi:hypothetical protein